MIGGNTRVNLDVPPFFLYSGFNVTPIGVNRVGLERAGFSSAEIAGVKKMYRILYTCGLKLEIALERILTDCGGEAAEHLVRFIRSSERGICRP